MREYFATVFQSDNYLELWIRIGYFQGGKCYQLFGDEYKEVDRYSVVKPTLRIHLPNMDDYGIGQKLVDGFIKCGISPSIPIKNNQEVEAIRYHLEDMRKIVFKERK